MAGTIVSVMNGLEGVVAADTTLSMVDGERGELIIAGYAVEELAMNATFEETAHLLWCGRPGSLKVPPALLAPETLQLLAAVAKRHADPMDALRMAVASVGADATGGAPSGLPG